MDLFTPVAESPKIESWSNHMDVMDAENEYGQEFRIFSTPLSTRS